MKLTYLNGPEAGSRYEVTEGGASIGRETDNSIQLLIGGISRYHARIEYNTGIWKLRDLGSTNGTYLNGRKIADAEMLCNGDIFTVGDQQFRVEIKPGTTVPEDAGNAQSVRISDTPESSNDGGSFSFNFGPADTPAPAESQPTPKIEPKPRMIEDPKPVEQQPAPQAENNKTQSVSFDNLFGQNKGESATATPENKNKGKKGSLLGNVIFAVVLLLIIAGGIGLFLALNKTKTADPASTQSNRKYKNPFAFYYERQHVSSNPDNVFKVSVCGEFSYAEGDLEKDKDGVMKPKKRFYVRFTLDDLASKRRIVKTLGDKTLPINRDRLIELNHSLESFVNAPHEQNESNAVNSPTFERMVICNGNDKVVDVTYYDTDQNSFNQEFQRAKDALSNFLEDISPEFPLSLKPAEEVLDDARQEYAKGTALGTGLDRPEDLKNALFAFQRAVWFYSQFELTPNSEDSRHYIHAQERLAELKAERDRRFKEHRGNAQAEFSKGNYDNAFDICTAALKYLPPDTEKYNEMYELRLKIEMRRNKMREGNK